MAEALVLAMKNRHLSSFVRAYGNARKEQAWWTNGLSLSGKLQGENMQGIQS